LLTKRFIGSAAQPASPSGVSDAKAIKQALKYLIFVQER
jgi:hypothetical protein